MGEGVGPPGGGVYGIGCVHGLPRSVCPGGQAGPEDGGIRAVRGQGGGGGAESALGGCVANGSEMATRSCTGMQERIEHGRAALLAAGSVEA